MHKNHFAIAAAVMHCSDSRSPGYYPPSLLMNATNSHPIDTLAAGPAPPLTEHTKPKTFWRALQIIPGLTALPPVWCKCTTTFFEPFRRLCLQPTANLVRRWDCPHQCGCLHGIILRNDFAGAIAACRCEPPNCPDIPLSIPDITPLEVNFAKLGRNIARALHCNPKHADLALPFTAQIGSWSTDAVPLILTTQLQPTTFRLVLAELAARLRNGFILLAPTADDINAHSHELLTQSHAAFFSLESILCLATQGFTISSRVIRPLKSPLPAILPLHYQSSWRNYSNRRRRSLRRTRRNKSRAVVFEKATRRKGHSSAVYHKLYPPYSRVRHAIPRPLSVRAQETEAARNPRA